MSMFELAKLRKNGEAGNNSLTYLTSWLSLITLSK